MRFIDTTLEGAYTIEMNRIGDERGFFARSFCEEEFLAHGLPGVMPQCSVSFNRRRGTLRGMHYQAEPHAEEKLIRCTAGAAFDVIVDLRPGSRTYRGWFGTELTARNRTSLYVPKGFAHGFLTLSDDTEILYMMSVPYVAGYDRGVRWNDPAFAVEWPLVPTVISGRDAAYPLVEPKA
jgi:dTDP-4-dehydrorhamnose 3,5-epimerase